MTLDTPATSEWGKIGEGPHTLYLTRHAFHELAPQRSDRHEGWDPQDPRGNRRDMDCRREWLERCQRMINMTVMPPDRHLTNLLGDWGWGASIVRVGGYYNIHLQSDILGSVARNGVRPASLLETLEQLARSLVNKELEYRCLN